MGEMVTLVRYIHHPFLGQFEKCQNNYFIWSHNQKCYINIQQDIVKREGVVLFLKCSAIALHERINLNTTPNQWQTPLQIDRGAM